MRSRFSVRVYAGIAVLSLATGCGGHGSAFVPSAPVQNALADGRVASDAVAAASDTSPSTATTTHNLVLNGGAEANVGAPDDNTIVKPADWKTTGQFTAVQYGAEGGFPTSTTPGPPARGKNFFAGGNDAKSTARQTISLAAYASDIDAGLDTYDFSAWIGGFEDQTDQANVSIEFESAGGTKLAGAQLDRVTAAQRKNMTALLFRSKTGPVPEGAREAIVSIVDTRFDGEYSDGYADDISLVLKTSTPTPAPTPLPTPVASVTPSPIPKPTPTPNPSATATIRPVPSATPTAA
jgi:hypothetical protein